MGACSALKTCLKPFIGITLAVICGLLNTVNNLIVQLVRSDTQVLIPTFEIVFIRKTIPFLLTLPALIKDRKNLGWEKMGKVTMLGTGVTGFTYTAFTCAALVRIPLADVMLITFTSPFFTCVFSYLLLKEKLHGAEVACGVVSFIGVVFVCEPAFIFGASTTRNIEYSVYAVGALFALLAGISIALYLPLCRLMCRDTNPFLPIALPALVGAIVCPIVLLVQRDRVVLAQSARTNILLINVGFVSFICYICQALAVKIENTIIVNLINNLDIIYAFVLQFIAFHIPVTKWKIIGAGFIVVATTVIVFGKWYRVRNDVSKEDYEMLDEAK